MFLGKICHCDNSLAGTEANNTLTFAGEQGTITGWGETDPNYNGTFPDVLQEADMMVRFRMDWSGSNFCVDKKASFNGSLTCT